MKVEIAIALVLSKLVNILWLGSGFISESGELEGYKGAVREDRIFGA